MIKGGAARRSQLALLLICTPCVARSLALAFSTVVEVIGTVSRNSGTSVGSLTPSKTGFERQAFSAAIIGCAAGWNLNALLLGGTPSEVGLCADAVAAFIVAIGALGRDSNAIFNSVTPGEIGLQSETVSAVV